MIHLQKARRKGAANDTSTSGMIKGGGVLQYIIHQKMRQVHQLLQEESHLPGKIKIVQIIHLTQQSRKRLNHLKQFGFPIMS